MYLFGRNNAKIDVQALGDRVTLRRACCVNDTPETCEWRMSYAQAEELLHALADILLRNYHRECDRRTAAVVKERLRARDDVKEQL